MNYKKLTKLQLDILRESCSIGASYAATALSQILGKTIMIEVPKVNIVGLKEFSGFMGSTQKGVSVCLRVFGDVVGGVLLLLSWDKALALANMIKGENAGSTKVLSDMDQSALKECGSIVTASYLRAMGQFMKVSLVHSVPRLIVGNLEKVLEDVFRELSKRAKIVFCIDTQFIESKNNITGHFILIPEVKGLEVMLSRLQRESS